VSPVSTDAAGAEGGPSPYHARSVAVRLHLRSPSIRVPITHLMVTCDEAEVAAWYEGEETPPDD
jgi:hypothetical protein